MDQVNKKELATILQCKECTFFVPFVNVKSRNFQKLTKKLCTFSEISMMQPIGGTVKFFYVFSRNFTG